MRGALQAAGHRVAYAVLRAPLVDLPDPGAEREGQPPIDREALARLWQSFDGLGELEATSSTSTAGPQSRRPTCSSGASLTAASRFDALGRG